MKYYLVNENNTLDKLHEIINEYENELKSFQNGKLYDVYSECLKEELSTNEGVLSLSRFKVFINTIPFVKNICLIDIDKKNICIFIEADEEMEKEAQTIFAYNLREAEERRLLFYKMISHELDLEFDIQKSLKPKLMTLSDILVCKNDNKLLEKILIEKVILECLETKDIIDSVKKLIEYGKNQDYKIEEINVKDEKIDERILLIRARKECYY